MASERRTIQSRLWPQLVVRLFLWAFLTWMWSARPPSSLWIVSLLMFSPVVLMGMGEPLVFKRWNWTRLIAEGLAIMFLAYAFLNSPSLRTGLMVVPWLVLRVAVMVDVLQTWYSHPVKKTLAQICFDLSGIFPVVGATWLVMFLSNWTPWNFDPLIVLLTSAHFHHAGFTLPLMAGLNAKAKPSPLTKSSCITILAGVPLVAVGITCTHFGVMKFVEPIGVTVLVFGALGVAVSQLRRSLEREIGVWTRIAFVISGASLFIAMLLAMGFGLRYLIPDWSLTMPQMWMIHGTLNAFGFGLCGILAWREASR